MAVLLKKKKHVLHDDSFEPKVFKCILAVVSVLIDPIIECVLKLIIAKPDEFEQFHDQKDSQAELNFAQF